MHLSFLQHFMNQVKIEPTGKVRKANTRNTASVPDWKSKEQGGQQWRSQHHGGSIRVRFGDSV